MKKKWIYVTAGVIGFIGAIVGLYFYVKKAMPKIGKAIDDAFDIEQHNDQYGHYMSYHPNKYKQVVVPLGGVVDFGGKWIPYQNTVTGTSNWYHCINTVNMFDGDDGK